MVQSDRRDQYCNKKTDAIPVDTAYDMLGKAALVLAIINSY